MKENIILALVLVGIVAVVVFSILFNIFNFITCFNVPIAEAPARCLLLKG